MLMVLINLDPIDIDVSNVMDHEFMKWYEENRPNTKMMVLMGYHLLKDGVDGYMKRDTYDTVSMKKRHAEELTRERDKHDKIMKMTEDSYKETLTRLKDSMNITEIRQLMEDEYKQRLEGAVRLATLEAEKRVETNHVKTLVEMGKFKDLYEELKVFVGGMVENEKDKRISELTTEMNLLKKSNIGKGNKGENLILNSLKLRFPQHFYEDTSKEKQTGDLHMVLEGENRVMFESKYKQTITKQDVDKFYRDIVYLQETHRKVICGVFVSMLTKNIPGIGEFKVEIRDGVPVMFLGFADEDEFERWFPEYVHIALELGQHTQGDVQHLQDLVRRIRPLVDQLKSLKVSVEKLRTVYLHQLSGAVIDLEKNVCKLVEDIGVVLKGRDECVHCSVCGEVFPSKKSLGGHMKIHNKN